jgi:D-psicose/D-tagatose/L-ribulose 3-epimerase
MTLKIGLSTFVLASPFSDADLEVSAKVAKMGFTVLEVCIEDPSLLSAGEINRAAKEHNLEISICGAFGPDRDVSHEDSVIRANALEYIKVCIDLAAEVGSKYFSGPMYSATGKTRLLSPELRQQQFDRAVDGLRQAGEYAATKGVGLAIEPLNRFETDLINTLEQGTQLCDAIDLPNVGLMIDTFHMNIEEKSLTSAIEEAKKYIFHVQVSENDRGTPGSGQVHWDEFFLALKRAEYRGSIVIESFLPNIAEIARAVSLWRPVAPSMDYLATEGFAFTHDCLVRAGL